MSMNPPNYRPAASPDPRADPLLEPLPEPAGWKDMLARKRPKPAKTSRQDRRPQTEPPQPPPGAPKTVSTGVGLRLPRGPHQSPNAVTPAVDLRPTTAAAAPDNRQVTVHNSTATTNSQTNITNHNHNTYNIHATSHHSSESLHTHPRPDENYPIPLPPWWLPRWASPAWPWLHTLLQVFVDVLRPWMKPLLGLVSVGVFINILNLQSTWTWTFKASRWLLTYVPLLGNLFGGNNMGPDSQRTAAPDTPAADTPVPLPSTETELTQVFREGIRGAEAVYFTTNEFWRQFTSLAMIEVAQPLLLRLNESLRPAANTDVQASANTLRQHSDNLRSATEKREAFVQRGMARLQRELDMFPVQDAVPEEGIFAVCKAIFFHVMSWIFRTGPVLREPWLTVLRRLDTLEGLLNEALADQEAGLDKMQGWEVGNILRGESIQYCALAGELKSELRLLDGPAGSQQLENPGGEIPDERTVSIYHDNVVECSRASTWVCRISREAQGWWGTKLERARREHDWLAEEQDLVRSKAKAIRAGKGVPESATQVERMMRDVLRRWRAQMDTCWGGDGLGDC